MAYQDWQPGSDVAFGSTGAAAIGSVALVAAEVVSAPAFAVGSAVADLVSGVAAGIDHLGRWGKWR
jgi:hypothetical protein